MMKQTLIEKIISHNAGRNVHAGEIVTVNADYVMLDDIMMPFIVSKFREMGFSKVWDPSKIVIICDHLIPASQVDDVRAYKISCDFAHEQQIPNLHKSDGICHQLMTSAGYVKPGHVVFGTDSHTTTYGCVGAFSTGIGYTEMAGILGTGNLWVRVPETIRININGTLADNVSSKDVILKIIGDLTASGATYRSLEFGGDTIRSMSVSSRMTMANMAIEAGSKCGLFAPDEKTAEYCHIELDEFQRSLAEDLAGNADTNYSNTSDSDTNDSDKSCSDTNDAYDADIYERVIEYRAEDFVPVMAVPSNVDHIVPVADIIGKKVDQVFLGSCTNGRLEDLMAAAEILKGKHIAPFVRFIVTPASRDIYLEALSNGTIRILLDAGAQITHPSCGLCCGRSGGILTDGETVVATNNRNFLGRMGSSGVNIYLASPKTAAACALSGSICLP